MRSKLAVVAALMVVAALSLAQQPGAVTTETSFVIVTKTIQTPRGRIRVYLPADMAAGDTISGTVSAEPSGQTDKEKQRNAGELNGYVIELENQKSPVSGGVIQRVHLAPAVSAPLLILLDSKGKQIAVTPLVVLPSAPTTPNTINIPTLGQAGRPVQIQGPFDGDSSNTNATIGGTDANVLAESPRQTVVQSPSNVVGPSEIKVTENGATTTGPFRNLKIDLTAPKTSLLKGESTELHVQVSGLEGITQPIPIQLQNQTPSSVNLSGGNTQNIVIQPSQVQTGGTFQSSGNLTGTGSGPFMVTASLPSGFNPAATPSSSPSPSTPPPTPPQSTAQATVPSQTNATASPRPSPAVAQTSAQIPLPTPTPDLTRASNARSSNPVGKPRERG